MTTFLIIVIAALLAVIGALYYMMSDLAGMFLGVMSAFAGGHDKKAGWSDIWVPRIFWAAATILFGYGLWRIYESLKIHLHWT